MKFSYSAVWDDTVRLIQAHAPLIAAVAGAFMFLPSLLLGYLLPPPESASPEVAEGMRLAMEYYARAWPWFLLSGLLAMLGTIAILRLIFDRGTTVGGAIATAAALLPFYFLLSLISGFIVAIGLFFLILPGLYLAARVVIAGPVMVAENRRNPVDAIARAFALTKGRGWALLGLLMLVVIAAIVAMVVVNTLLGILFTLLAGQGLGRLLALIVSAATSTAFTVLLTLVYAAIYRALESGSGSTARVFE